MGSLPIDAVILLVIAVTLAIYLFYRATYSSKIFLAVSLGWVVLQSGLGLSGFYHVSPGAPPQVPLAAAPPLLLIVMLFVTRRGRAFIDRMNMAHLTLVHIVGIPVELMFILLQAHRLVPQALTFDGYNFDIISGLTAPLVYYFGFVRKSLSRGFLIAWNVICTLLLINAATIAILSLPAIRIIEPGQPDMALGLFPFILLPGLIVPLVIFSHLASLRQLARKKPAPISLVNTL